MLAAFRMPTANDRSEWDQMYRQKYQSDRLASLRQTHNNVSRHLPRVASALPFGRGIRTTCRLQHPVKVAVLVAANAATYEALAITPDAGFLHCRAKIAALPYRIVQSGERAQLAGQSPHNDDRFYALST